MHSLYISTEIDQIKHIALNRNNIFSVRKEAIFKIANIPHKNKNKYLTECLLSFISDDRIPILNRYSIFSENRLLDNEIQSQCHSFYFHNFHPPKYPIRLKLLSAQYLLQNQNLSDNTREIYKYIIRLSKDKSDHQIQAECMDILIRCGYTNISEIIENINVTEYSKTRKLVEPKIENLPENRRRILVKRRTVYDDGQNVHNSSINENVKEIIKKLYTENNIHIQPGYRINNLNEVSMRMTHLAKQKSIITKQKLSGVMDRIMIDTSKFECGVGLCDVLILIWIKIKSSNNKDELEKRLLEEMEDANGQCASGLLSRLVNVLSGFFDGYEIKIAYKDQLKNYIYNHYNKLLVTDKYYDISESILNEMTESEVDKKINLMKMISDNNIEEFIRKEFVYTGLIKGEDFTEWFDLSIKGYCGIEK